MLASSSRSCSGACTHDAMETVRAARMCARAPGDAPAVRSGISWRGCSTQRLWSMHTRCHGDSTQPLACVRACAPDDKQPCSSHTRNTQPFFFLQVEVEPPFSPPASLVLSFHCDANLYKSDLQSFAKTTFARNPRRARPALPATPGRGQSQGYGLSRGHGLCQTLDSENERSADDDTQFLLWSISLYMPRDSPVRGRSGACQCKFTLLHHDNIHTCDISHFCSIICGAIVSESVTIVPPLPANQSRLVAC